MRALSRIFRGRDFGQVKPLAKVINDLWKNGEQGVLYDAPGFADTWNQVGSEFVTNGVAPADFTGWTHPDTAPSVTDVFQGTFRMTSAAGGALARLRQGFSVTPGVYKVSLTVSGITGTPGVNLALGNTGNGDVTYGNFSTPNNGNYSKTVVVTGNFLGLAFTATSTPGGSAQISNISVKEWLGNSTCSLFQDASGTLPCYMPGQGQVDPPVGLLLDKRLGLVRGPNVVINGTFDSDTADWGKGEGWSISGGALRKAAGVGTGYVNATQSCLVIGRWYEVTLSVISLSTDSAGVSGTSFSAVSGSARLRSSPGTVQFIGQATSNLMYLTARQDAAVEIDVVSAREIAGNHAYQTTTTSRPTLSARYNLLTNTVFSGAAVGVPGTAPTGWSSNFNTASITGVSSLGTDYVIQLTASAQRLFFAQSFSAASSTTYSLSCLVSENSGISIEQILNFTGMPTGATLQWFINGVPVSASAVPLAGSRAELRLVNGATAGTPAGRVGIGCSTNATGVVSVAQPDVRVTNDGVGLPPYQRVVDASNYDTVGFPLYMKFDGVDDWLQTAPIDFSGTDKVLAAAVIRKLSDAAVGMVFELSSTAAGNNGAFFMAAPITAGVANLYWRSNGTIGSAATSPSSYPSPGSSILTGIGDISGNNVILRVNGSQVAQGLTGQGSGNYGNYPLYIGRRAGTSLPFNGRLYSLLIRGASTSDSLVSKVERYLNLKAKIY